MAEQPKKKDLDISLLPEISAIENFQPDGQRCIIKPDMEYAIQTKGGVYLPQNRAEERRATTLSKGEIISTGELVEKHKAGQHVYFYWHEGDGMLRTPDDTVYIVLPEYSIRGHIVDNDMEKVKELKNSGTLAIA